MKLDAGCQTCFMSFRMGRKPREEGDLKQKTKKKVSGACTAITKQPSLLPFFPCAVWKVRIVCQLNTESLYRLAGCSQSVSCVARTEPGQEHTTGDTPRHRAHPLFTVLRFEQAATVMPNRGVYTHPPPPLNKIGFPGMSLMKSSLLLLLLLLLSNSAAGCFGGSSWRLTSLDSTVNSRARFARFLAPRATPRLVRLGRLAPSTLTARALVSGGNGAPRATGARRV